MADLADMLLLAFRSSIPKDMGSTAAILASFSTEALSRGVQVGDLKSTVSESMADIISPAISRLMAMPFFS